MIQLLAQSWTDELARLFPVSGPGKFQWGFAWALLLLVIPAAMVVWRLVAKLLPGRDHRLINRGGISLPWGAGALNRAEALPRTLRQRLVGLPWWLGVAGMAMLILAIARPQLNEGKTLVTTQAIAIQLVVDRSGSMGQQLEMGGTVMTRLDAVKRVLREFAIGNGKDLQGRGSDLLGLVTFCRFAETICPMVRDHFAVVQFASGVQQAESFEDGTAIGEGLALAAARLRTAEQEDRSRSSATDAQAMNIKSKVIVLLTDGANNAGQTDPLDAAKLCAQWGIKVYTIGIGGPGFISMSTPMGEQRISVAGDIDSRTLKQIAELTGGVYREAQDGDSLRRIYTEIDRLEKTDITKADYTESTELFMTPALLAGAALIVRLLLAATWLRRLGA